MVGASALKSPPQSPSRIFVSHSHKDNDFGLKLVADLERVVSDKSGVWYDISGGLAGGDEWWDKIVAEITARPIFVVILSPDAMESRWVKDEIRIAWTLKGTAPGRRIIPIEIRPTDVRADLRSLHIISFLPSRPYSTAFNELLTAITHPADSDPSALASQRIKASTPAEWAALGQPWRTEPEIDDERQQFLAHRRATPANIEQGIYPFKDVQLTRADVEWLLATHEDRRGPIDWGDEGQRKRIGLDLRGADLRGIDLSGLPLACMRGGLEGVSVRMRGIPSSEQLQVASATAEQRDAAAIHLEGAILWEAHLEGAILTRAYLDGADLSEAYLTAADLNKARMVRADLTGGHLESSNLSEADLEGAILVGAQLASARLSKTRLIQADLREARLVGADLSDALLAGANLRRAFFDSASTLANTRFGDKDYFASIAGVHWGGVDLSTANWSSLRLLADEQEAHRRKDTNGRPKSAATRLAEYEAAFQAIRQVAVALRDQGINEYSDRFAYRAQVLQRQVLRRRGLLAVSMFSWLLDLVVGYGYRPGRIVIIYFMTIFGFAALYWLTGLSVGPTLPPTGALVLSITSFHGRGFFPGGIALDDPITQIAAIEAILGLFVEISFIATFTQRFLGR